METKSCSWNEASYGETTVDLSESLFSNRWDELSPFNVVPSHLFQRMVSLLLPKHPFNLPLTQTPRTVRSALVDDSCRISNPRPARS